MRKGYTNGQKAHEKILNVTNHQGNANKNNNEILLHTYYDGYYQKEKKKEKKITSVSENVEKLEEALGIAGRDVKWYSCYGKQYGNSSKN